MMMASLNLLFIPFALERRNLICPQRTDLSARMAGFASSLAPIHQQRRRVLAISRMALLRGSRAILLQGRRVTLLRESMVVLLIGAEPQTNCSLPKQLPRIAKPSSMDWDRRRRRQGIMLTRTVLMRFSVRQMMRVWALLVLSSSSLYPYVLFAVKN